MKEHQAADVLRDGVQREQAAPEGPQDHRDMEHQGGREQRLSRQAPGPAVLLSDFPFD